MIQDVTYPGECCELSWRMFCVHLRRKGILPLLGGMFYKYQLNLSGLLCHLKLLFTLSIFCLDGLSIRVSGVLKSPTIIVLLSVSPFMVVSICLMY